jgi:hypothetical protein
VPFCTGAATVTTGSWTFVAIVKQGSEYSIYMNNANTGNANQLMSQQTDASPNLPNATGWTIAGNGGGQGGGLLDEIRLTNQALDPSEFLIEPP